MFRKERRTFGHLMSWADEFLGDDCDDAEVNAPFVDGDGDEDNVNV